MDDTQREKLRKATPQWKLTLMKEALALGKAHQFGTMLGRMRTAAAVHKIPYEDLLREMGRLAVDLGEVTPLIPEPITND